MKVGHSEVVADTAVTPKVVTSSNNAELSLGGTPLPIDEQVATAPPSTDPPEKTLIPLNLSPLANVQAIRGNTAAQFVTNAECVPAVSGPAARYLPHPAGRGDRPRRRRARYPGRRRGLRDRGRHRAGRRAG